MTTPLSYDKTVPKPGDFISQGQDDFLQNFNQLFNAFGSDHVALNDATNPGKHSVARLVEQASGTSTNVSELAFYSKDIPTQTTQLFYRNQGNGEEIQYNAYQIYPLPAIYTNDNVLKQLQFFSYLPGGIIIYFGQFFPAENPDTISINPVISSNIFGINVGLFGSVNTSGNHPPRVTPLANDQGLYVGIKLDQSNAIPIPVLPSVCYIAFGNS